MFAKYAPNSAKVDGSQLSIGGVSCISLAEKFGTPLYVIDEQGIRENCRTYKEAFSAHYANYELVFASKALCTIPTSKIISQEGFGFDVASGGELYTVLKAGVDPKKIYFHGNNKPIGELKEALTAQINCFVVDNFTELLNLEKLSRQLKKKANVMLRINPGIEAHTHEYIQTGKLDSKFGLNQDKLLKTIDIIKKAPDLNFIGLHAHIGSQIFESKPFSEEIKVLLQLVKKLKNDHKVNIQKINVGGGVGIAYQEKDQPLNLGSLAQLLAKTIYQECKKLSLDEPVLILEPGRSIVGNAGVTLYTIGSIKKIPKMKNYIMVDGGMSDNPRPILYQAIYSALLANRACEKNRTVYNVAGRFCESGDILIKEIKLPEAQAGDILAVFSTGAYCYSMASNYNRVPRPAMVIVNKGKARLAVKRESYEDLVRNDLF